MYARKKLKVICLVSLLLPLIAKGEIRTLTDVELAHAYGMSSCCCNWELDYCSVGEDEVDEPCAEINGECLDLGALCLRILVEGPLYNMGCGPSGQPGEDCYPTKDGWCEKYADYHCIQETLSCECEFTNYYYSGTRWVCTGDPC